MVLIVSSWVISAFTLIESIQRPQMDSIEIKRYMLDKTRACRLNVDFDREFMAFVKARNSNVNKEIKAAITAHMALNS